MLGAGGRADLGGVTKLPPLTKTHSVSLPSMWAQDFVDPRDVKMSELERVINQYQEKLSEVIDTICNFQNSLSYILLTMEQFNINMSSSLGDHQLPAEDWNPGDQDH